MEDNVETKKKPQAYLINIQDLDLELRMKNHMDIVRHANAVESW